METKLQPNGEVHFPIFPTSVEDEKYTGPLALDHNTFSKNDRFPLVRFTNGSTMLCAPLSFTVEGLKGTDTDEGQSRFAKHFRERSSLRCFVASH
ncbi:hypothetical protein BV22DRAFT_131843 [Leucogyrophana mollusca]|uniref:Uncharacterized protein n=1 Tax=Leucogyrophana mollusca TaxID=85980 RepID=A0ACB8BUY6_9AGAM|nr:hypothetical protein BV22DRAFT_131843 [Leucogyrophana mollusca]